MILFSRHVGKHHIFKINNDYYFIYWKTIRQVTVQNQMNL